MSLSIVFPHLPLPLRKEISLTLSTPALAGATLAEVRMRRNRIASVTIFRSYRLINIPLSYIADDSAMKSTFSSAVGGSLYAYEDAIKEGYVTMDGGVRVGVAGRVFCKDNRILSVSSIDSLVFRLPSGKTSADALFSHFQATKGGILLFSPPGGGKTTLLRALATRAAREFRVAIIDTREELCIDGAEVLVDRLVAYPKAKGAEIAVRTLSPELLILDELGKREAEELASLVCFGVRTVASVHGEAACDLTSNPALVPLFQAGMFAYLWDVRRSIPIPVAEADAP